MMALNLNLLSPAKRKGINELMSFIFIKNILELATFVVAVIAIFLLWSWTILINQFNNLSESAISVNKEYGSYAQEIRVINKTNRDINLAGQNYATTTPKFFELLKSTPADIVISAINFERDSGDLVISGTAKNRNSLLNYQTILKNISWLDNVVAPTSQFFQKENINFEITAKIKMPTVKNTPAPQKTTTTL